MKRFQIFCGADTNGHNVDGKEIALRLAAEYFPAGHTVYEANGRWIGLVGVIDELTIVVEFLSYSDKTSAADARNQVQSFAAGYKIEAKQESVLVTEEEVNAWFI